MPMRYTFAVALALLLAACGTPDTGMKYPTSTAPSTTAIVAPTSQATAGSSATLQAAGTLPVPGSASGGFGEYTDAKGNRILGSLTAPVTLTDYSDFL